MRTRELVIALALVFGCSNGTAPVATAHQPPAAVGSSPVAGAKAPDGQLTGTSGTKIALAGALHEHARTVLVFYRGYW